MVAPRKHHTTNFERSTRNADMTEFPGLVRCFQSGPYLKSLGTCSSRALPLQQIFSHRPGSRLLPCPVASFRLTKGCLSFESRVERGCDCRRKGGVGGKKEEKSRGSSYAWLLSEEDSGREWLLKEAERERTIRKKGRVDVNGDVNGVASPVKGKREENRDKCEDDGGENEREIRRFDNERESEKGGGRERQGVGRKKGKSATGSRKDTEL